MPLDPETPEQHFQRDLQSYSHEQDLYKHIATLSAGAIVVLTSFWERTGNNARGLLGAAMLCFVLSILGAVSMQIWSVLDVNTKYFSESPPRWHSPIGKLGMILGFAGMPLGMLALVAFAFQNL